MADSLPSFGNISAIDSEGNSIHEHQTLINSSTAAEIDSQETTFNDSQTTSQRNADFITNDDDGGSDPTDDASGSAIMEMDTEPIIHGVFSAMVDVEDTINVTPDRDDAPHDPESAFESHSYYQRLLESVRREDALSANIQSEPMEESVAEEDGTENIDDSEITVGGDGAGSDDEQDGDEEPGGEKLYQLPISKVKKIMKTDPDTKLITKDALAAMAISTEHFLAMLAQQSFKLAVRSKKKRIALEHVKSTITSSASCDFLEGTIPEFDI